LLLYQRADISRLRIAAPPAGGTTSGVEEDICWYSTGIFLFHACLVRVLVNPCFAHPETEVFSFFIAFEGLLSKKSKSWSAIITPTASTVDSHNLWSFFRVQATVMRFPL
jgi:hypothetical protein